MNPTTQLLFNLLARHQHVSLPGLGTFRVERTPAVLDETSGTLVPPANRLTFDESVAESLSLPACMASLPGMEPERAEGLYEQWLADLKKYAVEGSYVLEGICILTPGRTETGKAHTVNPSAELARLLNPASTPETLHLQPLEGAQPTATAEPASPIQPGKEAAPKSAERKAPSRISMLAAVAAGILVIGGMYLLFHHFGGFTGRSRQAPATATVQPVAPKATTSAVDKTPPVPTTQAEAVSPASGTKPKAETEDSTAPRTVYRIISGVFSTRENAERHIRENGLVPAECEILPTPGGKFMVSIRKYTDRREANRTMMRMNENYPGVWIHRSTE